MTDRRGQDQVNETQGWRRWFRSVEAAATAGIVFAITVSVSLALQFALPKITDSDSEILAFYEQPGAEFRGILALELMLVAIAGFLWFMAVIRNRMGDREPKLFATVFFGGGIIIASGLLFGTATLAAPSVLLVVGGEVSDVGAVSLMRALGVAVLIGILPKIQALFVFSTSTLGLRTKIFPRWLVVLGSVVGVGLLINVTFYTASVYVFPAWVLVVSAVLLVRPRREAS